MSSANFTIRKQVFNSCFLTLRSAIGTSRTGFVDSEGRFLFVNVQFFWFFAIFVFFKWWLFRSGMFFSNGGCSCMFLSMFFVQFSKLKSSKLASESKVSKKKLRAPGKADLAEEKDNIFNKTCHQISSGSSYGYVSEVPRTCYHRIQKFQKTDKKKKKNLKNKTKKNSGSRGWHLRVGDPTSPILFRHCYGGYPTERREMACGPFSERLPLWSRTEAQVRWHTIILWMWQKSTLEKSFENMF